MQNKLAVCVALVLIILTVRQVFSQVDKYLAIGGEQKAKPKETVTELQKELQWLQAEAFLTEVVTASKKTQKIWESPSTITIITAEDIRAYGYQTLWDALKTVVGSIPSNDRFRSFIGTRGLLDPSLFNSRILWLVDGHTINESYFQWAFPDYSFGIDLDNIEKIEIVRGPASVLYGNSAFLGVINVVTKRGADVDGIYLSTHAGGYTNIAGGHGDKVNESQDALAFGGGVVTFGKGFGNGGDLLLSATYHKDFGQALYVPFWQATKSGGIADGFDFTEARYIFAKYHHRGLRLLGKFSDLEKGRPFGDYASTPNHEDNRSNDRAYFIEARHEHTWNASVDTMVRAYYDHTKFVGRWFYEGFSPLDVQTVPSDWFGTEVQASWKAGLGHILAGFEYQNHKTSQTEDYPSEPLHETNEYRFSILGIYLQDDIKLLDNMNLNLGGRYEHDEDFGGIFVFRSSIAYLPITNTVVKLHYGDAFKNPLRHNFYYVGDDGLSNNIVTQLIRERIRTVELAATHLLNNNYKVDASLFYSKLNDPVTFEKQPEIAPENHYYNTAGVNSVGGEIEFRYSVPGILEGYLNGTYQRTKNKETKERVLNSPAYSVKFGSIVHTLPDGKLDVALEGQLYGKADYQDERGIDFQQDAFSITNLILTSKGIFYRFNLSLGIYNVLNQAYEYSLAKGIQQPPSANGRSFRLKVASRF